MNILDYALRKQDELTLRASPKNLLAGITPTITGFTVQPTNMANATDGDPTNPTGVGTKQPARVEYIGYFEYDLGSPHFVEVSGLLKMWCVDAIAMYVRMAYKLNSGDSYVEFPYDSITVAAAPSSEPSASTPFQYCPHVYTRYIRFGFKASGSASGNMSVKPYEFAAHELKLAAEG